MSQYPIMEAGCVMLACLGAIVLCGACAQPAASPPALPVEPCESVMVAQARQAISSLKASGEAHGGTQAAISATYTGTLRVEAHMMMPGLTRAIPVTVEVIDDPASRALLVRETTGPARNVETTLVLDGRVASQFDAAGVFKELSGDEALGAMADASCWMPWSVVRAGLGARPTCRVGATQAWRGESFTPVTFVDAAHRACSVLLDGSQRVGRVEVLAADQRLGDVCHWTAFAGFEQRGGAWVPRTITRFMVRPDVTLRYELSLARLEIGGTTRDAFLLPEAHRGDIASWGTPKLAGTGIEFVPVGEHVWAAEIGASDSRVLVLERDHDLVTLGAPDGDGVCAGLVAALARSFPGKPVGLAAFGHHHPAPSGGLRAIAATGATIVLPRGLEAYARWMLARKTDLGPPAVSPQREPRLDLFDGETTIDCGDEKPRLIDIGEKSAHAFHYVVFYLPKAGVLFEDDLGYFPANRPARANPRLVGLVGALDAMHVRPTRLIQSWPVKGVLKEVSWADVEAIVKAGK